MRYFIVLLFFYVSFCGAIKAQVGINTANPTEFLDIDGNIRIRDAINIDSLTDPSGYANLLKMNSSGVWGYIKEKKPNNYKFYDVYSYELTSSLSSTVVNGAIYLGVSIRVEIPARSAAIFFIDYNIPISVDRNMAMPITALNIDYAGITLFKTGGVELQDGSRKFTIFRPASMDASTVGMPVLGKSVQKVENTTDTMMYINYYLNGYIETNPSGLTVRFGMYSPTGEVNGGKGLMTITSFVKDITST